MNVRVLLAESDAEDTLFLQDVLTEIETGRHWNNWVHIETHHAASWDEASMILANEPIDLILLDPDLIDGHGVSTFRRVQAIAEQVPMVLLIGSEDGAMGVHMVREGAQDFLFKKQIDCRPLAHAMRNAMERHRLMSAARAASSHRCTHGASQSRWISYLGRSRPETG